MKYRPLFALLFAVAPLAAQPVPPVPPVQPAQPVPRPAPLPMPAIRPVRPIPSVPFFDEGRIRELTDRVAERVDEARLRVQELQGRAEERALDAQQRAMERSWEVQQRDQERGMERAMEAQQRAMEVQERAMGHAFQVLPAMPPMPPMPVMPSFSGQFGLGQAPYFGGYHLPEMPPAPWAQSDPADSLYRTATQVLNRGDYRKAAAMFKDIPVRFQYSSYAPDAMYWQAHALYRIGNTPDLQEALAVLEALKQKYPNPRTRGQGKDVNELSARVAGVLSSRGVAGDAVKRALAQTGASTCDSEDQSVRAQALSALMETDADAAAQMAQRILAKKDDCSVQLRRNAVMIVSRKRDAQTLATLTSVAKSDPSSDVRQYAVRYLASMPGDDALAAIEELLKSSDDQNVQREAVRALVTHSSPRARQAARAIVERNDAQESLRISALRAFDRERSTSDDANWLRTIYPKVESARVKAEIVITVTRIGGEGTDQWLLALAKNEDESLEARSNAVRRAAQTMDIPSLGKFYDGVAQQQLRSTIIDALGSRPEAAATDKLLDIVKNGTDYRLREQAISTLTRKKDPRTTQLLLDLIDKKP
jgi:TolA-binding protein/HEAT repeat protein